MDSVIYVDPYSNFFPLRVVQKIYVFMLKIMLRTISFFGRASWYRLVRFALDICASVFFVYPKKASRKKADVGGMSGEWLWWEGHDSGGTILYVHGGGYSMGSPKTHRQMAAMIARFCSMRALILQYPLAPEHPFPSAPDKALAAYQWLLDTGVEPGQIAVMGDSSGGGLALALLQIIRDRQLPLPGCGVMISPWTDLACTGNSMRTRACSDPVLRRRAILPFARLYAPEDKFTDPAASPLYGSMRGLPRLFFMVGTDEILLDDTLRINDLPHNRRIRIEVWKGMFHVWPLAYAYVPFFKKAFVHIGNFIEDRG